MSSDESSSSNSSPAPGPEGKTRSSAALAGVSLVLMALLVWAMAPSRAKYKPAPLRPVPAGCPKVLTDFVPTDATEVPGVDLSSFTKTQRNHILYRLNMEPCPCSCNTSIAACRLSHPACPVCKDLVEKILLEERQGQQPANAPK